jgi:hypothetical protein
MIQPPNIVAIHGAPRSGTSWLGQIFNSAPGVEYRYQPFFSYAFRGRVDERSTPEELETFFSELLSSRDDFLLQSGSASLATKNPTFIKSRASHLVYKEVRFHHLLPELMSRSAKLKAIGVVRDPRSVLASWFKAPREFDPAWSRQREWRHASLKNNGLIENWYGFERWKELCAIFIKLSGQYPARFKIVQYEHLVDATKAMVDELFGFCGIDGNEQTDRFIQESTSRNDGDPYGVYRQKGEGRIETKLDPNIEREIVSELRGTALERFLIT